ncbi:TIGR03364 family FAD-dependent oxidoreductase [Bradyrhizobium sp. CCBAU 45384]|uniref:TIGR03364 family FAD-dependent oxidoreductase n=1 Tax=Bradyrhizobium sp. CCBAU 45384 TaxID=858428 RepID=UPI002304E64C|nr:TIGR03364 family FAD-dependent oxidoreductase [Bradyrhizobium sp. CCBAU 45384]MDA9411396.1 FAD-dependent oxidoreductase [Bradyrhizobium sp. CCBAU 45384]
MSVSGDEFDLAVIGGGICGLAHALAGVRRGLRVVVIERDARANGASIRNFGFVTVTGQQRGRCWQRAMRSRQVWAEVAAAAGIRIEHAGLAVAVRRPEAAAVLEAFRTTEMGEGCELLSPLEAGRRFPMLRTDHLQAVLASPHDLRVESRIAVPALAKWLAEVHGVTFLYQTLAREVAPPDIDTTRGPVRARLCVVCPGDDFVSLYPERISAYGLVRCKLHMLRVASASAAPRFNAAVMSDLGLVRYLGYAELPEAAALKQRLESEQGQHLANGVHLIAVQSEDGSLVVGDSHHYDATPDPFGPEAVDELIMDEFRQVLAWPTPVIRERWIGTYASASDRLMLIDRPSQTVRLVMITSGTGASTSFAIAEEVIDELTSGSRAA